MAPSTTDRLRDVFGPLSQSRPGPSPRLADKPPYVDVALAPEILPQTPILHEKTGIVLLPSRRIDGSELGAPWIIAEPTVWNWLRTAQIEHVEERVLDGVGGAFWARCRGNDGELRSVLLRFDSVGFENLYGMWGLEYSLSIKNHDVLRREQAAYEAAKALGCEDLAPPIAARQVNLVPLMSDAAREKIAAQYETDPLLVDESFGVIGAMQLVPLNASNFVEYWSMLGPDFKNQFENSSDSLRYGIYRLIALDFIFGTGNRALSDLLYNDATGSVAVYGFGVTFPDPIMTADKYLKERAIGWDRPISSPMSDVQTGTFPCGTDSLWLSGNFGDRERAECLMTFTQMAKALDESTMVLLCQIMEELGVPRMNTAGFVSRVVFLQEDPESVIDNSHDFTRSVLVPMRRGYGFDAGRNLKIVNTVNQILTDSFGEVFDFARVMQTATPQ